jgi:hypothetical protein
MARAPFWGSDSGVEDGELYSSHPWDIVYLAGRPLPGLCEVKPTGVASLEVDKKKGKGISGARLTIVGYDPKTFDISCEIMTAEQWEVIQDIIEALWTVPKKKVRLAGEGLTVHHPSLQAVKIFTAVIVGITPAVKGSAEGSKVVTFHMQESVLPTKSAVKTVKKSEQVPLAPEREDQPPKNFAPVSPGNDRNYTSPFPRTPVPGGSS